MINTLGLELCILKICMRGMIDRLKKINSNKKMIKEAKKVIMKVKLLPWNILEVYSIQQIEMRLSN